MDQNEPSPAGQPQHTYEEIAELLDWHLLTPDLSEEQLHTACQQARDLRVASVLVRPSDVELAARWLAGSGVKVAAAVGYPYGGSTTAAKLYEGRDLLRRGAQEIAFALNLGKMVSRQFPYNETELLQMATDCQKSSIGFHVVLESQYLALDLSLIALKICRRVGADFAVTGWDEPAAEQVNTLTQYRGKRLQIKAGGAGSLDQALAFRDAGCTRIGSNDPAPILAAWREHLATQQPATT